MFFHATLQITEDKTNDLKINYFFDDQNFFRKKKREKNRK